MTELYDAVVILGAKLEEDGTPSAALRRRLDHGLALYDAGAAPFLLFSGGQPRNGVTEAEAMRRAALAHGVAEGALRLEELSRNTLENAMFCKPLIQRQGWRRLLLVTDGFHMPRALYTFARLGDRPKITVRGSAAPAPRFSPKLIAAHGREVAALAAYVWRIERGLRGWSQ